MLSFKEETFHGYGISSKREKKKKNSSSHFPSSLIDDTRTARCNFFPSRRENVRLFSTVQALSTFLTRNLKFWRGIGRQTVPFTHPAPERGEEEDLSLSLSLQRFFTVKEYRRFSTIPVHCYPYSTVLRRDFSALGRKFYSSKV